MSVTRYFVHMWLSVTSACGTESAINTSRKREVRMGPECSCCHKDSERCIIANGHHTKSAQQYRGEGVYIYYIYIYIYIPVYIHCIDILYEHSGAHWKLILCFNLSTVSQSRYILKTESLYVLKQDSKFNVYI